MFALAASGFNKPSETFIRSHARHLAPDRTLLIAERREVKRPIDAPAIIMSKRLPIFVPKNGGLGAALSGVVNPTRLTQSKHAYLAALLRDHDVRVIMAEYGPIGVNLLPAAKIAGCPLYVHFHGVDASRMLLDTDVVQSYQALFEYTCGVIAPSAFLADKLAEAGCARSKLHVVPCGVPTDAIALGAPEPFRLVAVGRFTEKKAPLLTIAAFAQVIKTHPDARLEMLGDGPLFEQAKEEVARLGLIDRVSMPGVVTSTQALAAIGRAQVFVQHSVTAPDGDTEGMPVAIMEAMASGVPVVSTRHSGIPEAVTDGVTGYLVPENDVEGMAGRICALLADASLAEAFGRAGRKVAEERFSESRTIKMLQDLMGLPHILY